MTKNLKEFIETTGCPCHEAVSEEECEDCQDLPRGTFAYWRKQKQESLPEVPEEKRYPKGCPTCSASINGHADWDKSCCNSCANYEPPQEKKP